VPDPRTTLLVAWAGVLVAGCAVWLWSLRRRDAGVADVAWGLWFVGLVWWFRARGTQPAWFHLMSAGMVSVWGLRLALHIAARGRGQAEDRRYAAMRAGHGRRFWWVSLGTVFWLQATLALVLALPLWAVQAAGRIAPVPFALGSLLWVFGFVMEVVADWQLQRFRSRPDTALRVLDGGLWRYSRHPNYFGEAMLWWGYGLMAVAAGAWWTLFAPALMTWLLLRVSGVTLLEKTMAGRRPDYERYVRRTSAFLPWPPRDARGGSPARESP